MIALLSALGGLGGLGGSNKVLLSLFALCGTRFGVEQLYSHFNAGSGLGDFGRRLQTYARTITPSKLKLSVTSSSVVFGGSGFFSGILIVGDLIARPAYFTSA